MVIRIPRWLLPHRVTIEPYAGDTGRSGKTWGAPFVTRAMATPTDKLITDQEGRQVVATAQVIIGPGIDCPVESKILLPGGIKGRVASVAKYTAPGMPVPDCTEVLVE